MKSGDKNITNKSKLKYYYNRQTENLDKRKKKSSQEKNRKVKYQTSCRRHRKSSVTITAKYLID